MTGGYSLREVSPKEVRFSKQNPRGEKPGDIKADKTFEQLKDSVVQFGVLVPIVVHEERGTDGKRFTLIDGERRLRAALASGRERIPAHIATAEEPLSELVQAFHIHMLRKQWRQVATARALKRIKAELQKKGAEKRDKELLEELQAQTGCTDAQLKSLERGIQYPEAVLKEVDEGKIKWSHLIQIEQSFVEQLQQHYGGLLKELGVKKVRDVLTQKARRRILSSTRALIDYVMPVIVRARTKEEKKVAEKLLKEFVNSEDMPAEEIKKRFEKEYPPPRDLVEIAGNIIETAEDLRGMLELMEVTEMISFRERAMHVRRELSELKRVVSRKLRQFEKLGG